MLRRPSTPPALRCCAPDGHQALRSAPPKAPSQKRQRHREKPPRDVNLSFHCGLTLFPSVHLLGISVSRAITTDQHVEGLRRLQASTVGVEPGLSDHWLWSGPSFLGGLWIPPRIDWQPFQVSRSKSINMMLMLKLQYFVHLMQRADSLENTMMLGNMEGRRKRGRERMRWFHSIPDSIE